MKSSSLLLEMKASFLRAGAISKDTWQILPMEVLQVAKYSETVCFPRVGPKNPFRPMKFVRTVEDEYEFYDEQKCFKCSTPPPRRPSGRHLRGRHWVSSQRHLPCDSKWGKKPGATIDDLSNGVHVKYEQFLEKQEDVSDE